MLNSDPRLTRKDAIKFLGIPEKRFDNFWKNADEFSPLPRPGNRGRLYFHREELTTWREQYRWRTIMLDIDDYLLCLDFALAMHFRGYVLSDWGTGRQREFGQKVTNWVKGQLGEIAVKKFFEREFQFRVELDFELHNEIVPQDIIAVIEPDETTRQPNINVGIKSSKPKSAYLVLSPNEVELENRRSDVYIFCRPELPDDHLLRISSDAVRDAVSRQPHFQLYGHNIPGFEVIPCEIAGYCWRDELELVTEIPGQKFDGERYVKQTGRLHRTRSDWQSIINEL